MGVWWLLTFERQLGLSRLACCMRCLSSYPWQQFGISARSEGDLEESEVYRSVRFRTLSWDFVGFLGSASWACRWSARFVCRPDRLYGHDRKQTFCIHVSPAHRLIRFVAGFRSFRLLRDNKVQSRSSRLTALCLTLKHRTRLLVWTSWSQVIRSSLQSGFRAICRVDRFRIHSGYLHYRQTLRFSQWEDGIQAFDEVPVGILMNSFCVSACCGLSSSRRENECRNRTTAHCQPSLVCSGSSPKVPHDWNKICISDCLKWNEVTLTWWSDMAAPRSPRSALSSSDYDDMTS